MVSYEINRFKIGAVPRVMCACYNKRIGKILALCYLHEQTFIRARSLGSVHSRMDGTTDKCVDCPRLRLRERGVFRGGSASAIEMHNLSFSRLYKKKKIVLDYNIC